MATKDPQGKNTSGGGHLGGTHLGQSPDAKTDSSKVKKGDKARPNDGKK
ncbi:hypothetical protein [Pararhizobium sp. DWP3-4]